VEQQVHERVAQGAFDFSVFVGDRFLKREPEDEIKVKADRALAGFLQLRPNAPHYHLIGNHDWTKNNRDWHTSESLKGISNLVMLDKPLTIDMSVQGKDYLIHALPADVPFDAAQYAADGLAFNLFLFHGIVKGSLMSESSSRVFDDGISLAEIDLPGWDMVLGGDIHVPQTIPFVNCEGGYTGSVLQRTRADADQRRGWLEVTATKESTGWSVEKVFVPTRNFFHREVWHVDSATTYESISVNEDFVSDNAVEIKLVGARQDVDRVADDGRWVNYKNIMCARSIEVIREYQVEQSEAVVDMSVSSSALDDLTLYLGSGFANIGTLSQDKIFAVVKKMQGVL